LDICKLNTQNYWKLTIGLKGTYSLRSKVAPLSFEAFRLFPPLVW